MTSTSASSRKNQTLSKIASNRLQKELVEWQVNPPSGFIHKPTDNLQRWVIEVRGAPGTLYSNETFQLEVVFPGHYPMEAPQVIFLSPAPLHPHIYSNGHICLDILYDSVVSCHDRKFRLYQHSVNAVKLHCKATSRG